MSTIREFVPTSDEREAFDEEFDEEFMPVDAETTEIAPLEIDPGDWLESVDVLDHGEDDERPHRVDAQ